MIYFTLGLDLAKHCPFLKLQTKNCIKNYAQERDNICTQNKVTFQNPKGKSKRNSFSSYLQKLNEFYIRKIQN